MTVLAIAVNGFAALVCTTAFIFALCSGQWRWAAIQAVLAVANLAWCRWMWSRLP